MSVSQGPFSVEPLQDRHDRTNFVSGVAELDQYFQTQVGQDARRKVAAPFVLVSREQTVVGYYTLSAYTIRLAELPAEVAKKLPRYPLLQATLLGRLAISRNYHGQRLGQFLLMDALYRSWENTREIGSVGVVVEAYNESAEEFYRHHEFISLPGQFRRLLMAMATIKKLFSE
jgi:predicted GNAT family N-acyltransferase